MKHSAAIRTAVLSCFACCSLLTTTVAQDAASQCLQPPGDNSCVDAQGAVRVTRVVPVPGTVSPEAQKWLAQPRPGAEGPYDLSKDRAMADAWQTNGGEQMRKVYPVNVGKDTMAGVPVRVITPLKVPGNKLDRVLINVHGGGFNADWGSMIETIPIANLTQTKVVAVLYGLAPDHPFPFAVDQTVAVYQELLKTYKPQNIGLYGTSAGAILTGQVAAKLRQLGLPLPAALGIFSGSGDMSEQGDSMAIFGLWGLSGPISRWKNKRDTGYTGTTNLKDPVLSPIYSDLKGFPPTLFLTSERDLLLSNTVNLHRVFRNAGVDAQLVVFDALPHAFWNNWELPESQETYRTITDFFNHYLGK